MNTLAQIVLSGPQILLAITVHEYAHGWMAWKSGDPTAKLAGRLTLNPIPHIDPIGLLMFLLVRIGWARPVPINPLNFRNFRRDTLLVAAAGPISNFVMAFLFGYIVIALSGVADLGAVRILSAMLGFGVFVNIILALLNLIPIPPLDGSRIVASIFGFHHRIFFYDRYGMFMFLGLILLFRIIQGVFGFHPLMAMMYGVAKMMFHDGLYTILKAMAI